MGSRFEGQRHHDRLVWPPTIATQRFFNIYWGCPEHLPRLERHPPIPALDTYEHAYFIDYAVNRGAYIDAFMKNLDWDAVQKFRL